MNRKYKKSTNLYLLRPAVNIYVKDLNKNPFCDHGPTVLFEKKIENEFKRYFACSTCRDTDRKLCPFYLEEGMKRNYDVNYIKKEKKIFKSHREKYKLLKTTKESLLLCENCSVLFKNCDHQKHMGCENVKILSEHQKLFPSQIISPKSDSKNEAQYFFTEKSLQVLLNTIKHLQVNKVLCIGVPRLYEHLRSSLKSLLMDIDQRFCNFFSTDEFILYNMFNHYFFGGKRSKNVYLDFLKGSEELLLITDPPFGGRMELIANTISSIEEDWKSINGFTSDNILPLIFIFPYFLEKSVKASMPSLNMLEYQVDYDNHALYTTGRKGLKRGSPVRLFTNMAPHQFPFPEEEGYSFCAVCRRWVHPANAHCDKCADCTSKDGRTYKHCDLCGFCVKPAWQHCTFCVRCLPKDHQCRSKDLQCLPKKRGAAPLRGSSEGLGARTAKKQRKKNDLPLTLAEERERNLSILKDILK